jgi:diguanylate cyclase (GGDEF)-like protein
MKMKKNFEPRTLEIDDHGGLLVPTIATTSEQSPIDPAEPIKLRISYDRLIARLERNEQIARKFHEIELRILSIKSCKDLFEVLLSEIENQFDVPYAWITLIQEAETAVIQSIKDSNLLKERLCLIEGLKFTKLIGNAQHPMLINENLSPYFQLLPPVRKYLINSMAVVPLFLNGKIVGSLNQGDFTKERFEPGLDTSLLEQLAIKVSLCLSNVIAHEKLQMMACQDPLTGLLNRRVMSFALCREFKRARRYGAPVSVVFVDVNDFKQVNDKFGHDAGDRLLTHLANQLLEMTREVDILARFAGDEFVLILPDTSAGNAKLLLARIQDHLASCPCVCGMNRIMVSVSFGIASTEDRTIDSAQLLLKKADEALYQMKDETKAQRRDGCRETGLETKPMF